MKTVKIMFKDKPVIEFETPIDDFTAIIEMLYTKYGDAIGFEIKSKEESKVKSK